MHRNPLDNLNKIICKPGVDVLEENSIKVKTYIRRNKTNRETMEVNVTKSKLASRVSEFKLSMI